MEYVKWKWFMLKVRLIYLKFDAKWGIVQIQKHIAQVLENWNK